MIITISRQYGAGGSEVARRVAARLGWRVVDNELVEEVAARAGLPPEAVAEREDRVPSFAERLARTLAASTPELFAAPEPGGTVPKLQETDLVRITETVVAEVAAKGRVVLVGRGSPARRPWGWGPIHSEPNRYWTTPTEPGPTISDSFTAATGTTRSTTTWC